MTIRIMQLAVIVLMAASCNMSERIQYNTSFKEQSYNEWKYFDSNNAIPQPYDMMVVDSSICVLGLAYKKVVHEYSINTGELINSCVRQGDLPGCVGRGTSLSVDSDNGIYIFDINGQELKKYSKGFVFDKSINIDSLYNFANGAYIISRNKALVDVPNFYEGHFSGHSGIHLFDFLESRNISNYYDYPRDSILDVQKFQSYKRFAIPSSADKFAIIYHQSDVIQFFKLMLNGLIELIAVR
ncbi:MAG: hypothetical protein NC186_06645 [Prevotella sp.]|nr:hypothetical protein [Prevotella sp.]